jgi:hypothetical protein
MHPKVHGISSGVAEPARCHATIPAKGSFRNVVVLNRYEGKNLRGPMHSGDSHQYFIQ